MWECLIVLCHSRQLKVQINSLKNSGGDTLNYCLVWPGAGRSKGIFRFSKFGLKLFFSHKRETLSSTEAPVWYSFLPFSRLSMKKHRGLCRGERKRNRIFEGHGLTIRLFGVWLCSGSISILLHYFGCHIMGQSDSSLLKDDWHQH